MYYIIPGHSNSQLLNCIGVYYFMIKLYFITSLCIHLVDVLKLTSQ